MIVPDEIFTNGTDVRKEHLECFIGMVSQYMVRIPSSKIDLELFNYPKIQMLKMKVDILVSEQEGLLTNRSSIKVPSKTDPDNPTGLNGYFAMGDNSTDSLDGRAGASFQKMKLLEELYWCIIHLLKDGVYQIKTNDTYFSHNMHYV